MTSSRYVIGQLLSAIVQWNSGDAARSLFVSQRTKDYGNELKRDIQTSPARGLVRACIQR